MKLRTLEAIFRALEDARVRYLVVGGVAVNVHGYQRATQDLDLVVELGHENVIRALEALETLGYGPALPVGPREFADADKRREWREERNLEVFSMISHEHPDTTVDLFVNEPFDFDQEREAAFVAEVAPGIEVPFVDLATLIAMKEEVGRPRDRDDADQLRWILENPGGEAL